MGKSSTHALLPEQLEDFIHSGELTPPQEKLTAEFRDALDAALHFLSPADLGVLDALVPHVVRGSKSAALKVRLTLAAAMKAAHRDRGEDSLAPLAPGSTTPRFSGRRWSARRRRRPKPRAERASPF
jgi:hypothetical protein